MDLIPKFLMANGTVVLHVYISRLPYVYTVIFGWNFFKKMIVRKQHFQKQSSDITSCYCYSIILKLCFRKCPAVFKIFVNWSFKNY